MSMSIPKIAFSQGNPFQEELILNIVKQSLKSDIHYYLDFSKNEIPEVKICYFNEKLIVNGYDKKEPSMKVTFPERSNEVFCSLNHANYVLFHSDLVNGKMRVDILFNRAKYLNRPGKTQYETWSRNNGGMSYEFLYEKGRIYDYKKKVISND